MTLNIHETTYGLALLYRDPLFDQTLATLRAQGGYAAVAADKAEEFIGILSGTKRAGGRSRFRFTRKGEYRIRNCRKVDLGCGYRIVCIQKDRRLVLLYIGTHDDCFRWIDRHRTAEYDLESVAPDAWMPAGPGAAPVLEQDRGEQDRLADAHEDALMERIDDAVLRKVFAGVVRSRM